MQQSPVFTVHTNSPYVAAPDPVAERRQAFDNARASLSSWVKIKIACAIFFFTIALIAEVNEGNNNNKKNPWPGRENEDLTHDQAIALIIGFLVALFLCLAIEISMLRWAYIGGSKGDAKLVRKFRLSTGCCTGYTLISLLWGYFFTTGSPDGMDFWFKLSAILHPAIYYIGYTRAKHLETFPELYPENMPTQGIAPVSTYNHHAQQHLVQLSVGLPVGSGAYTNATASSYQIPIATTVIVSGQEAPLMELKTAENTSSEKGSISQV